MKKSVPTLIVTGADAAFFPFLSDCVASLRAAGVFECADLAILDQGLTGEQLAALKSGSTTIVRPTWADCGMDVPENLQKDRDISLVARSSLPTLFPGYEVYIWFDADAWVQTSEFLEEFIAGARQSGLAVAKENGAGYSPTLIERRWWLGNYYLGFGVLGALRGGLLAAPINIGVLAIHRDAPHWEAWRRHHEMTIWRTGKINLDQHSCHAVLALDRLPATYVPARCNWLPTLSMPVWDEDEEMLYEPGSRGRPLSVVHLAGPNKLVSRRVRTRRGRAFHSPLTYPLLNKMRLGAVAAG